MRITVVGTGYVGLVSGTCFAEIGNDVTCVDIDAGKIARLKEGECPIYEMGLPELLRRNLRDGRLRFTTSYDDAAANMEVAFIAVGTPSRDDGAADTRAVHAAAAALAERVTDPATLAIKSTVPVGTCLRVAGVVNEVLARRGVAFRFPVVSAPEFLREGRAIEDFMRPDRIVVGAEDEAAHEGIRQVYRHFIRNGHAYLAMDTRSSEMTKYAANAMLATRISFMNELAQICERLGADVMAVRNGMGSDERIGMAFLYPGVGFGGSCFPKDVRALSRMSVEADCPADLLGAVERVNRYQKLLLANRVVKRFGGNLQGRRIALWGISYKPKTDDIREAPALAIAERLLDAGATICAYDPEATDNARRHFGERAGLSFATDPYAAAEGADALLLATEWAVFRNLDFARLHSLMKQPIMFDGRNQYEPEQMRALGFEYHCIGRGSTSQSPIGVDGSDAARAERLART